MRPTRPPGRGRLTAALALELVALGALVLLVTATPPSLPGAALALVAGAGAAALVFSAWEWSVHHYVYHRILAPTLKPAYLTHHRDHHFRDFPSWRFTGTMPDGGSTQAHGSIWQQVLTRARGVR